MAFPSTPWAWARSCGTLLCCFALIASVGCFAADSGGNGGGAIPAPDGGNGGNGNNGGNGDNTGNGDNADNNGGNGDNNAGNNGGNGDNNAGNNGGNGDPDGGNGGNGDNNGGNDNGGNDNGNGNGDPDGGMPDGGDLVCDAPESRCGDACFDLSQDDAHCGRCEIACRGEQRCVEGSCTDPDTGGCPDSGCPDGTFCDLNENRCTPGCLSDDGCAAGQICDGARQCVPGCREDGDCAENEICDAEQCRAGCRVDAACPLGQICDGLSCKAGCADDSRCPEGQRCEDGGCVTPPACDPPCGPDERCDAERGVCTREGLGPEADDATCGDGRDNDGDGFVDCFDRDCTAAAPRCQGDGSPENTTEACTDGIDNDGNGFTDCYDFACTRNAPPEVTVCVGDGGAENTLERCTNDIDDNGNGFTDCAENDCKHLQHCGGDEIQPPDNCADAGLPPGCEQAPCAPDNPLGQCSGRQTCAPTLGLCAVPLEALTLPFELPFRITEIMPNPTTVEDVNGEFLEAVNISGVALNVRGLVFQDARGGNAFTVREDAIVEPGARVVFAASAEPLLNGGIQNAVVARLGMANRDPDGVTLLVGNQVVAEIHWAGLEQDEANTGLPALSGRSLQLDPTDDSHWCYTPDDEARGYSRDDLGGVDYGTPGTVNPICPLVP